MHVFSSRRRGAGTAARQFNLQTQPELSQRSAQRRLRHDRRVGRGLDLRHQGGESFGPVGMMNAAQQIQLQILQQREPSPGRAPAPGFGRRGCRRAILHGKQHGRRGRHG